MSTTDQKKTDEVDADGSNPLSDSHDAASTSVPRPSSSSSSGGAAAAPVVGSDNAAGECGVATEGAETAVETDAKGDGDGIIGEAEVDGVDGNVNGEVVAHDDADIDPTIDPTREGDIEARAEQVRDFVEDLLTKMGMNASAELLEPEPDDPATEVRIEIEGPDSGRIIGKKGQVLAAIQHIVNRIANRPNLERLHVIVDAEGYRQRREDILASMAQRLGKRALEEGKIITFEPMSPRDRRIVHLALAKFPGVVTKSDGEGEGRRVQIIPVRR